MTSRAARFAGLLLALLVFGGPSCSSHTPGIEIEVAFQSTDTPAFFVTDLGYRVELDRVLVNFAEVELVPCAETGWLAPLLGARALAHTTSSPTVLGEPHVIELVETLGLPQLSGLILPPPDEYCALRVRLAPADDDAAGLPADVDFVGLSLRIDGVLTPDGGSPRSFFVEASDDELVELPFAEPLLLDLDDPEHTLIVSMEHLLWLESIDFDSASPAEQAAATVANLITTLDVRTTE